MKLDPILSKAARLARSKKYELALKVLKDEEDRYLGSFKYYYLYGVISLYSGAFTDALKSFNQARNIKINDPYLMLGMAVLYLKRMNTVQAVNYYLDVQEIDQKNKIAKRALAVIRKHSDSQALSDWMTPEKLAKLFPPIPFPGVNVKAVVASVLILTAAVVLFFGISYKIRSMPSPRPSAQFILSTEERNAPLETDGPYMKTLKKDEAAGYYDKALSLFKEYRDEAAKIYLNTILASNASEGIKNKARLLFSYMEVPGFDNFKTSDNPSYQDVISEPAVYRDVYVIWKGMATNLEITDENVRFILLVGYDTRKILEGTVPVVYKNPISVNTERPLEVLGKITLDERMNITLEGAGLHQSGKLEN